MDSADAGFKMSLVAIPAILIVNTYISCVNRDSGSRFIKHAFVWAFVPLMCWLWDLKFSSSSVKEVNSVYSNFLTGISATIVILILVHDLLVAMLVQLYRWLKEIGPSKKNAPTDSRE
jgi:hypothetical protein